MRIALRKQWQQGRAYVQQHPWLKVVSLFVARLMLVLFLGSIAWVVALKYLPVWFTPLTISRKWDTIGTDQSSTIYKTWRPFEEINKEAALAVVASEDQQFPYHWGFDFDEIQDAIKENQTRKRPRGASTISQQVAKNVFLWNGRSYIRKGLEVYFTVLIELIWGKKRILEVYLNVAETGPMTFGWKRPQNASMAIPPTPSAATKPPAWPPYCPTPSSFRSGIRQATFSAAPGRLPGRCGH